MSFLKGFYFENGTREMETQTDSGSNEVDEPLEPEDNSEDNPEDSTRQITVEFYNLNCKILAGLSIFSCYFKHYTISTIFSGLAVYFYSITQLGERKND